MLYPYGVATTIYFPLIKAGVNNFAVAADYTYAAGDFKIIKDGGAAANPTNTPTAITSGNGGIWKLDLTATEMQAAQIMVTAIDAAAKAIEDQAIFLQTYGVGQGIVNINDWADQILKRGVATGEATADADSLTDLILMALNSEYLSSTQLRIYRTDGVTTHRDKTITSAGSGNVITKIT